jgi:putative selenium metabolism hydrolase
MMSESLRSEGPTIYPVDESMTIELARRLAMTPSESGSEGAAVEVVADAMRQAGMSVTIDRSGNAIGTIGRGIAGAPRLLIDGHIDTIPLHSHEKWTVDPHGGLIDGGRLYGLGICDQKGSIAAAVGGVAAVSEQLAAADGLVAVVASVCEEHMEGAGLEEVIAFIAPTAVITTEPSDARLMRGQRGRAKITLEIVGRACHAGHVGEGINAAAALALAIVAIGELPPVNDINLGRRDITVIDVHSLPYPSVSTVPGRAIARFDCRFPPGDDLLSLMAVIDKTARDAVASWPEAPEITVSPVHADFASYTGQAFSLDEFAAPWWTDGPLLSQAEQALEEVGLDPAPLHYSFCTNGSYTAGICNIPTIGFGAGEEHLAHQVDEHIYLDSLLRTAQGLAAIAVAVVLPG